MGFKCGIVGLPNVGKSTLFNALTATQAAQSANYPFCTIEPNIGKVSVPDERIEKLATIAGSAKIIPTQLEFVDIAGLVKGASKGEGLGNQFLANIREVDVIIHVVRCFVDDDITHVNNKIDPLSDAETIETELLLADLDSANKRLPALEKKARGGDVEAQEQIALLQEVVKLLEAGRFAKELIKDEDSANKIKQLQLLTAKPILYVSNVLEEEAATGNEYSTIMAKKAETDSAFNIIISSKIEAEIANLDSDEDKQDFLQTIGLEETGLNKIIKTGYEMLDLKSYFTAGPQEARAWTFKLGTTAPQAAGIIHTDFEKGFIRAEIISYNDYIEYKGSQGAKDSGKMRLEGKDYVVTDGDVIYFRFNV